MRGHERREQDTYEKQEREHNHTHIDILVGQPIELSERVFID